MKILADRKIPHLERFFGPFAEVVQMDAAQIRPGNLGEAEILLVRSVTQVNRRLLEGSQVRLVGTATIGTDHIHEDDLAQMGIPFFHAKGCNKEAVVDWVLGLIFLQGALLGVNPREKRLGILGVGEIGELLRQKALGLGFSVLCCDPLRVAQEPDFPHLPLEEFLCFSEILTLHLPLTRQGTHATYQLINERRMGLLPPQAWLLNSSRGEVVEELALLRQAHRLEAIMLDVFPNEPNPNPNLLEKCVFATSHIAGYSEKGKYNATRMIFEQIANLVGWEFERTILSPPDTDPLQLDFNGSLAVLLEDAFGFQRHSEDLKWGVKKRPSFFAEFRNEYRFRRQSDEIQVRGVSQTKDRELIEGLGFQLDHSS